MNAALLLAALTAAAGVAPSAAKTPSAAKAPSVARAPPAAPVTPVTPAARAVHAPAEAALLRAAFPDHDASTGWLGHEEGFLVELSSACAEGGACFLGVAAKDARDSAVARAWTTFFAFRPADGGWIEAGHVAGPVVDAVGRWSVGVSILIDRDGPFALATSANGAEGSQTSTSLWSWDGKRFLPVLSAATGRQGNTETETTVTPCADRPSDRPSWELRTREREGRGGWTETRSRVQWNGQAWVERAADRPCAASGDGRGSPVSATAAAPAATTAPATAAPRVRAATASKSAPAPKGQPQATAPANAVDGNRLTAWVAGGKKGGVGEWLQLDLAAPTPVASLLLLGTCPGTDWKAGPRLKKVRLRFEDGPAQEETLADVPTAQVIALKRKAPARWIRIELLDLYRGGKRQDACVTEVVPQAR